MRKKKKKKGKEKCRVYTCIRLSRKVPGANSRRKLLKKKKERKRKRERERNEEKRDTKIEIFSSSGSKLF
jgi:hypothetical protein